jgi:hypothetical protein
MQEQNTNKLSDALVQMTETEFFSFQERFKSKSWCKDFIKKELQAVRINSVLQEIEHLQSDALSVLEQPYEGMPEQPPEVIPEQSQKNTRHK